MVHHDPPPTGRTRTQYGQTYAQSVIQDRQRSPHTVAGYGNKNSQWNSTTRTPAEISVSSAPVKELEEIKQAIHSLQKQDQPVPPSGQLQDIQKAIHEIRTATTHTTSTLTETKNDTGQLLREITARQELQQDKTNKYQAEQQEKMVSNFQAMIKEMMKDMFQQKT